MTSVPLDLPCIRPTISSIFLQHGVLASPLDVVLPPCIELVRLAPVGRRVRGHELRAAVVRLLGLVGGPATSLLCAEQPVVHEFLFEGEDAGKRLPVHELAHTVEHCRQDRQERPTVGH